SRSMSLGLKCRGGDDDDDGDDDGGALTSERKMISFAIIVGSSYVRSVDSLAAIDSLHPSQHQREREKIGAVRRNVFIRTQIVKSRLPAYLKLVPIYIGFVARKRTSQGDEQKAQNSERRIGVGALQ
ncbi:hypothetical protein BLOT_013613, partial [Blomia tropicalis]